MSDPLDAYGDALRRALHAEADAVVPSPYGLVCIRERCDEPSTWTRYEHLVPPLLLLLILLFVLAGS